MCYTASASPAGPTHLQALLEHLVSDDDGAAAVRNYCRRYGQLQHRPQAAQQERRQPTAEQHGWLAAAGAAGTSLSVARRMAEAAAGSRGALHSELRRAGG